jgi:hypothetical protein
VVIEVKLSECDLDHNLRYLLQRVKIPYAFQIHLNGSKYKHYESINGSRVMVVPADEFLLNLL